MKLSTDRMCFLTKPYLLTTNPSEEMNILWIQKDKTEGFVEFGKDKKLGTVINAECFEITGLRAPREDGTYSDRLEDHEKVSVWQYIAKIEGLKPGETVYYRCFNSSESSDVYDFHTAPEIGEGYSFAQLSDLQGLSDCNETVYKIGCTHPDFILYSGDATYISWRLDQWFDTGEPWQDEETKKKAFFPCMQQENGARLLQYAPMFFCPGNHELDDLRCYGNMGFGMIDDNWNWSIFMQMLRPLYPDKNTGLSGRRWYSATYSDLHIISLNINRLCFWDYKKAPGWRLYDSIAPDSPQITWLKKDLQEDKSKFKWVIQHFHILNKGWDVQFNLCAPEVDNEGNAHYPHDHGGMLMDLYSENGVNAVTFGHSHVYERYFRKSTHYIEAAYLSVCFRRGGEEPHPSGLLPIVEDNSQRSFLIVERKEGGLFATGYYAKENPVPFDEYKIADENGKTVPPKEQ